MKKVLIANRGEIAVRIIRACKDYGLTSVAVYADADADAMFAAQADEAYSLNGATARETYLDIEKLIAVAKRSGADAVHPGYGFLSERAEFAKAVIDAGLIWIGPAPHVIEALGDKLQARAIAQKVGAPLVAGSDGAITSPAEALAFARQFGMPIAIKAAHGGGGRGMKIARDLDEVEELFSSATREAVAAFGRGECYVEQFLDRPRHIEAQVLADSHGNVVVVGTRDCSLQRRNQKLVEEAPAPFLSDEQRETIHAASRDICAEAGYTGAGTVEFLLSADGVISFLEVNTRLQVEHPVTEETTGLDLVIEQFRIAEGLPISVTTMPEPRGHAIEFRINMEDPGRGFLPSAGEISNFTAPSGPGVRLDSGVTTGSVIPPMFDSLAAKLVVWGATRDQAIARARRALNEFTIEGVPSVLPFHRAVLDHADFSSTEFRVHTRWIETDFAETLEDAARPAPASASGLLRGHVEIDGKRVEIGIPDNFLRLLGQMPATASSAGPDAAENDAGAVRASVPGLLVQWNVEDGAAVREGEVVAMMDVMKMETAVTAPVNGIISLLAKAGSSQTAGAVIARIAPDDPGTTSKTETRT
ncbi:MULTISPECIES: biotin carboxylase N-terminal domain-containing protein [unclassified Rhizobium]|uniref:acetyl/propionyl/methylcrotonyl-CoA carboxylase subunit alpha n=1 Tax=unclassified Rhizobium TaxID=2613769 RepID=UPI001AE9CC79|nr:MULTISPECIES: biotin carboxylase N-terminal domain-containing protein [unclassified Rhizobium]MBP2459765.1 acetyl-CoA/propionyl-CoA carboxylase biotin carboxyl carrier protein [Rhizobium sp. PvP014]MBP2531123.1 acetyl-CoA/propionyl-CoA carboxylase biotin carboxyl carrier protein [Rhizobium sp. PvP099]